MPSALTHALAGAFLGNGVSRQRKLVFCALSAVCSALPDIDVAGVWLGIGRIGMWGHRGFTHSVLFAFLAGVAVASLCFRPVDWRSKRWWSTVAYFFAVTASHGVFDALNESPFGVAFFAPFSPARYLFPYHLLPGIGVSRFFTSFGEAVLFREAAFIWCPVIVVMLSLQRVKRYAGRKASAAYDADARRSESAGI